MKILSKKISCIFCIILIVFRAPLNANDLNVRGISSILGYPESELVITDVTEKEKFIYSKPTIREAEDKLKPPVDPSQILAAYRITGKSPYSFYPIIITIAKEGAFLATDFVALLEKFSAAPMSERLASGYGYLGPVDYGVAGKGGIMLMEYRVPSPIKEMSYPSEKMGTISEIRVANQKIDIRIAMSVSLDEGGQYNLIKIAGGERYHGYFRKPAGANEDPWPEAPAFNWSDGFKSLNLWALNKADYNKIPLGTMPDSGDSNHPLSGPKKASSVEQAPELTESTLTSWLWWLVGLALVALVFISNAILKRRR